MSQRALIAAALGLGAAALLLSETTPARWLVGTELAVLVLASGGPRERLRLHALLSLCTAAALGSLLTVSPVGVMRGLAPELASAALLLVLGLRFAALIVPPRTDTLPPWIPALGGPLAALSLATLQRTLGGAPSPELGLLVALPLALSAAASPSWSLPTRAAALWVARALALPGAPPTALELGLFALAASGHAYAQGLARLALGAALLGFIPGVSSEMVWGPLLSAQGVLWAAPLALLHLAPLAYEAQDDAQSPRWSWGLVAVICLASAAL